MDVVVPVFNAWAHVEPCLASVLRHARGNFRLVIVDDASDEPGLGGFLEALAVSDPRVVLLRQEVNQGFVRSANRGMRHAGGRDVLLLNSDTLVPADFLSRLRACAEASQPPAIVTPLTNNGTICSVPEFMRENPLPVELGVSGGNGTEAMAALVSRVSLRRRPALVTAVGFCMWIPAEILARIGVFDEEHFGRGYGEENDFCERAKAAGFSIRLCDDLYVAHVGRASFGAGGADTEILHNDVMGRLHPSYHDDVQRFLRENPLREIQDEIAGELARVAAAGGPEPAGLGTRAVRLDGRAPRILQVTNGFPPRAFGGVELHTFQLVKALRRHGFEVAVFTRHSDLAPDGTTIEEVVDGIPVWSVVNDFKGGTFREHWDQPPVRERFIEVLGRFAPDLVHIQHLIGLSADLPLAARDAGIPVVATVHEYWWVCDRVMFQKRDGSPCSGPAHESCLACVGGKENIDESSAGATSRSGPPVGIIDAVRRAVSRSMATGASLGRGQRHREPALEAPSVLPVRGPEANRERWRAMRAALDSNEYSVTPSRFVLEELARHGMPLTARRSSPLALGVELDVWPAPTPLMDGEIRADRPLRLGFVGQHLPHKAPHVLLEAMLRQPELPLVAVLYGRRWPGHPYEEEIAALLAREPRASWGGRFPDGALPGILAGIDLLVVPSTCLEGFGIATREAFLAGRPVLSTTRGALPESVRDGVDGLLVPAGDPVALATAIARVATEPGLLAHLAAGALEARARVKSMDEYALEIERILYAAPLGPGLVRWRS